MEPKNLRYATTHEWAILKDGLIVVGLTKFAIDQLTDIVFIDLPDVGDHTFSGDSFGEIESVKAVSDIYAPVDGEIVEINKKLLDDPKLITDDPYGKGWMIKIKPEPGATLDGMLTLAQYEKQIAEESH